jgi:hypothetical protein
MKSEILVDQAAACAGETRASPRTALTVTTRHLRRCHCLFGPPTGRDDPLYQGGPLAPLSATGPARHFRDVGPGPVRTGRGSLLVGDRAATGRA